MESRTATFDEAAASGDQRFDDVAIWLHWVTLALVIGQFSSAWLLGLATGRQAAALLGFHRSLGVVIWCVTASRLGWRLLLATLPPFPESMLKIQQRLATLNEYGLYALLLLQPLTGLAYTVLNGRAFALFFFQIPQILPRDRGLESFFHGVHQLGAVVLLTLVGVHALAALFHRFVLRDDVLQRMLPAPRQ
jgi:cytochrome b561